jgi:hypothetical protein
MKWSMKVFLLAAAMPLLYFLAWHLCRITNLYWSNSLNIPAFVLLIMAEPWTSLVVSFDTPVRMNQLLDYDSHLRVVLQYEAGQFEGMAGEIAQLLG